MVSSCSRLPVTVPVRVGDTAAMRMQSRYLPAVAVMGLALACSSQSEGGVAGSEATVSPPASASAQGAPQVGTPFTAADAFFSAEFTGTPQRGQESVDTSTGTYPVIIYFDEAEGLGVTFSDLSSIAEAVPLEAFLAGTMDSIAEQNDGTVASQTRVEFAGTTAVEGVIEYPDAVQHVRAVLLPPGHGYTISQVGPAGAGRSPEFERLLATFQHLPA